MGGVLPTESNISMTGAGLVGKSTSGTGKSGRMDSASVLSWLGLSASGVTDGKALIASSNSIAWSPSAAALLPDTLPARGTLLSYGGSRQLAAGGNVSHTGDITLTGGANGIYLSPSGVNKGLVYFSTGQNRLYGQTTVPWVVESDAGFKVRNSANSADAALTCGAITASETATFVKGSGTFVTVLSGGSGSSNYNRFLASSGSLVGEYGIWNSYLYLQAVTGLSGVRLFGSSSNTPTIEATSAGFHTYKTIASSTSFERCGIDASSDASNYRLHVSKGSAGGSSRGLVVGAHDGTTWSPWLSFTSTGTWTFSQPSADWISFGSGYQMRVGGGTDMQLSSTLGVSWSSTSDARGAKDTGVVRSSSGVVEINNGTVGTLRDLSCRNVVASGAVMETPTQSTINPTTVNIPTGQRRGWYNSTLAEFRDWVNIGGTLMKSAAYT